ncbi:probable cytochrome P450 9f2, partial [Contarinia nasturtii]|uniref:probable cytochrome P450 9f2 n=1 Tax=Contarinia nasturtii TaxID=265458 RepID=UPI0012D3C407
MQTNPAKWLESVYYRFPNEKIIGFFDQCSPVYMLRDLDLICKILIKDADYFKNHWVSFALKNDTFLGRTVMAMQNKEWQEMRASISPIFTGSKLRHMFDLVVECADDMIEHFKLKSKQNNSVQLNMKEIFSRYGNDVATSCAFGLKINSFKVRTLPNLMLAIDIEYFGRNLRRFFKAMVLNIMEEREKKNIFRPDMINTLLQMRNGTIKHSIDENSNKKPADISAVGETNVGEKQMKRWNDNDIVAQCVEIYLANFEAVSSIMTFLAYELAVNPDIQQKLYEEIRQTSDNLDGAPLTYDTIIKMKYFDQVVSELVRKWPAGILTNRVCNKDYELELDGRKISIERNTCFIIPIYSIHHNPEIYPNPETFDPERFNDENKKNIKPGSYLPFGIGPRACIGYRMAVMDLKVVFFKLLQQFNIQPHEKTEIPLKIGNSVAFWNIANAVNLELKPR